jgi:hypothetical protein
MLKPVDPAPQDERPVGELVHQLVEEGKAYAHAEVELYKTIGITKAKAVAIPAVLFIAALLIGMASINALIVGVVIALETFIGPLAAGFVGMLIFAAVAGLLGWAGYAKMRRDL